ncbi:hypothetical protein COV82_02345 [Candidatus Peregrinibacteria bacterium CG11_big_fil_rev_8_21_14_0_20_46_8]|nr:MAG: hypothetical protein COV82_02345 [Candidatus Peregrinibacteria bacterium CG11_big_fil_rev_8_21_14_0_20_46_8]
MPPEIESDDLKIPAFLRKKTIRRRNKKPLLLTALDRKRAGIAPEGLEEPKRERRIKGAKSLRHKRSAQSNAQQNFSPPQRRYDQPLRTTVQTYQQPSFEVPVMDEPVLNEPQTFKAPRAAQRRPSLQRTTAIPNIYTSKPPATRNKRIGQNKLGTVTHYFDKIQVAVIKLSAKLDVGDCIRYETENGPYEQIVDSMEIERVPVFSAGRGKEVGMKIQRKPILETVVLKVIG